MNVIIIIIPPKNVLVHGEHDSTCMYPNI